MTDESHAALVKQLNGNDPSTLATALEAEGFVSAAAHLKGLMHESAAVIAAHPHSVINPGLFRPTPGDPQPWDYGTAADPANPFGAAAEHGGEIAIEQQLLGGEER